MPAKRFRPFPVGCGELLEKIKVLENYWRKIKVLGRLMDMKGGKCGEFSVKSKMKQKPEFYKGSIISPIFQTENTEIEKG